MAVKIQLPEDDPFTDVVRHALAIYGTPPCSVCGGPSDLLSFFWPSPSFARRIRQPKGKMRVIMYGICHTCRELPDREKIVEQKILRDFQVQ
jgi:hypothetical protein